MIENVWIKLKKFFSEQVIPRVIVTVVVLFIAVALMFSGIFTIKIAQWAALMLFLVFMVVYTLVFL